MAMAVAGTAALGETTIAGAECANISFQIFMILLHQYSIK